MEMNVCGALVVDVVWYGSAADTFLQEFCVYPGDLFRPANADPYSWCPFIQMLELFQG